MGKQQKRRSFGRLRRLPSGRWQAEYYGPDGIRYTGPRTWDAKIDGEGWLSAESRLIQLDGWTPPPDRAKAAEASAMTFREFAEGWLERRSNDPRKPLTPKTRWLYDSLLESRILPTFGDARLSDITHLSVSAWWASLGTATPTRSVHAYQLLRTIMNAAIADNLYQQNNPCQVKGAAKAPKGRDIDLLTVPEVERVTKLMPPHYQAAVPVLAWCGLRFGELIELRRKDITWSDGRMVLRIRRAATRVDGQIIVGKPKSDAGIRDVHVPPHVADRLAAHMKRYTGKPPESFIFRTTRGLRLSQTAFGKPFKQAVAEVGKPNTRVHDLRHVGSVLAAQAGATTKELMNRLGHSTPDMSMRYQHAAADRDAAIADRLSALAGWSADS